MTRLLLDQMLPPRLCERLADIFDVVEHIDRLDMGEASDAEVWAYARAQDFSIVTKDIDYQAFLAVEGPPPRVIWLRLGNATTAQMEDALRGHAEAISATHAGGAGCLVIHRA
jgi:predicted nuclease of predicted toxin-antitoxin system